MSSDHSLKAQLAEQRFLHGVAYVESEAGGLKRITTSELARLNQMLTGQRDEPWRFDAASVTIPSGKTHRLSVLAHPVHAARDILGDAQQMAGNRDLLSAIFHVYSQLVLLHPFKEANRRTAVLATFWLLRANGQDTPIEKLMEVSVGDLREKSDLESMKTQLQALLKA